jgi:glycosyltransferase involved in cell wall biosynthesis
LKALASQTFKDFEVVVVLKPSGDATEDIIEKYQDVLKIKLIIQNEGYIVDAINLGLETARGDIIAFLDDDAIPFSDWVQSHVETYMLSNVSGVAGDVIPAFLDENNVVQTKGKFSEIIPGSRPFLEMVARKFWSCPLEGLENYLVYISKAGLVDYNFGIADRASRQIAQSVLGMGANMSILAKDLANFRFPNSWVLGLSYEQFLGWHLWRKGNRLLFNPKIKVYHIHHGQTLSRNIKEARKDTLRWTEYNLLFYRLYGLEPKLSKMHRLTWLVFDTITDLKKTCVNHEYPQYMARLKAKFYSESIGLKWILSRKMDSGYSPQLDLNRLLE